MIVLNYLCVAPQRFLSFRVVTVVHCSLLWKFWEVFAEMDTNGDGVLELHEVGKLAEPWHSILHDSAISRGDGGNLEAFPICDRFVQASKSSLATCLVGTAFTEMVFAWS